MIPRRMLSREIYGNGLKDRVTACRKRLRVSRTRHKPLVHDEDEELFPETSGLLSCESSDPRGSESLMLAEEHEVGIT
jgi:hypothetical protein